MLVTLLGVEGLMRKNCEPCCGGYGLLKLSSWYLDSFASL